MRKIGGHVSIAGGVENCIERANEIGGNCAQIFSGSPRVWKRAGLETHDADKLFSEQEKYSVSPIFTHALYLVNLASDKPDLVKKSVDVLIHDMKFDALIKGAGIVVHLGSHQGRGWAAVRQQVAGKIKEIIEASPKEATFLIENSAGQKGKLCSQLEEIRWLLDEVDSPQLGWCLDTCHAFSAGYNLAEDLPAEITKLKLWSSLKCIHVNDSKGEFDQGIDRHENLGEGNIPQADLKKFLNLPEVKEIPLILEVPGIDGKGPDAENINRLKKLLEE